MSPSAPVSDTLYETILRQGQIKHALKTALACCLATGLAYVFHVSSGELAPVFVFLLMSLGMPSPRLNWLLVQSAVVISAFISAVLLVTFHPAPFLYVILTLLWIFTCLLFTNWFRLAATMGAMVSAIGIFVVLHGTVGATLTFYASYAFNYLIAGFSVVVVHTLLWPFNTRRVFLERLGQVYAHFEEQCRQAAGRIRSGEPAAAAALPNEWAPFRALRQLLAPELRRSQDTSNPFSRMILACRSVNARLWFFNHSIAPVISRAIPADARTVLASVLDRCADHLHALLQAVTATKPAPAVPDDVLKEVQSARWNAMRTSPAERDILLAQDIPLTVLRRLVTGIQTVTECHNVLLMSLQRGLAGEVATGAPAIRSARLIDLNSVRAGTKLVLMIVLLIIGEAMFGLPGGAQVAFFAAFFAGTGNLGRQNKTDLIGLAGLLFGFIYGVAAAFVTSHVPHFPLLLALVFLGEFVAILAFQALPRYSAAGLQAGLALPFAYLTTSGPGWGSFALAQTRFAGLVLAGFTALVIHAYLWPVLPMRQLRAQIAAALRDTAKSLEQLFRDPRATWQGAPASLTDTLSHAPDLLDDARYLPGVDRADPDYRLILQSLQEIEANLEYLHFLIGLEQEHPLRIRFFQVVRDYAQQARTNMEQVARQFQDSPRKASRLQPVRWGPDVTGRWRHAFDAMAPAPAGAVDPSRPAVLAYCLDQIARATEHISRIAREINLRNVASEWSPRRFTANHEGGLTHEA